MLTLCLQELSDVHSIQWESFSSGSHSAPGVEGFMRTADEASRNRTQTGKPMTATGLVPCLGSTKQKYCLPGIDRINHCKNSAFLDQNYVQKTFDHFAVLSIAQSAMQHTTTLHTFPFKPAPNNKRLNDPNTMSSKYMSSQQFQLHSLLSQTMNSTNSVRHRLSQVYLNTVNHHNLKNLLDLNTFCGLGSLHTQKSVLIWQSSYHQQQDHIKRISNLCLPKKTLTLKLTIICVHATCLHSHLMHSSHGWVDQDSSRVRPKVYIACLFVQR